MKPVNWLALAVLIPTCSQQAWAQKNERKPTVHKIAAGADAQRDVQRVLNDRLRPGDVVEFGEGTFAFTQELTVRTNDVTLRGQGLKKTILSFAKQDQGKQGILCNRDRFAIEDLTVENTKGDGIKVEGATGVVFRRVCAQWTGEPKAANGAYGLYPVQCKHVLLEDCEAYGASDAGIYVGQSSLIIVRRCRAERNVAGIEIENSSDADVYDNVATNNTGGLLIFDLPDLQVKNGRRVRAYGNKVIANNHPNFAAPGTIVATVSPGTGMVVLCTDQVEVFQNEIKSNQTFNLSIVSYHITGREWKDKAFDPIPEGVYVHDNSFADGGKKPTGERGQLHALLVGTPMPDIIWDGVVNPSLLKNGKPAPENRIVFKNNGNATFANLNWGTLGPALAAAKSKEDGLKALLTHKPNVERDITPYTGELKPLPAIQLPGVK